MEPRVYVNANMQRSKTLWWKSCTTSKVDQCQAIYSNPVSRRVIIIIENQVCFAHKFSSKPDNWKQGNVVCSIGSRYESFIIVLNYSKTYTFHENYIQFIIHFKFMQKSRSYPSKIGFSHFALEDKGIGTLLDI